MKFVWLESLNGIAVSLPVRGAWIEIGAFAPCGCPPRCRSPCGERGLKCPPRGESGCCAVSLPVRGAWIEMPCVPCIVAGLICRSPCGERGLKSVPCGSICRVRRSLPVRGAWIEIAVPRTTSASVQVAPRAGSVD